MPRAAALTWAMASVRSSSVGACRPTTWLSRNRSSTWRGTVPAASRLARLLVLTGEETLGRQHARARPIFQDLVAGPGPLVGVEQIRERREVTGGAPEQVVLYGLVNDCPVGDSVMAEDRDPQHVHVFVLERTGLVI